MEKVEEKIETAGEVAYRGATNPVSIISPYESAENALKDYFKEIEICINNHKKMAVFNDNDFFVVVVIKKERLLSMITPTVRRFFVGALACPAPFYDQNVYKYHKDLHAIEELWMMSDKDTCKYLANNKNKIDQYERKLLEYYEKFKSGDLWRLMKTMNNEECDTPRLKKRKEK